MVIVKFERDEIDYPKFSSAIKKLNNLQQKTPIDSLIGDTLDVLLGGTSKIDITDSTNLNKKKAEESIQIETSAKREHGDHEEVLWRRKVVEEVSAILQNVDNHADITEVDDNFMLSTFEKVNDISPSTKYYNSKNMSVVEKHEYFQLVALLQTLHSKIQDVTFKLEYMENAELAQDIDLEEALKGVYRERVEQKEATKTSKSSQQAQNDDYYHLVQKPCTSRNAKCSEADFLESFHLSTRERLLLESVAKIERSRKLDRSSRLMSTMESHRKDLNSRHSQKTRTSTKKFNEELPNWEFRMHYYSAKSHVLNVELIHYLTTRVLWPKVIHFPQLSLIFFNSRSYFQMLVITECN